MQKLAKCDIETQSEQVLLKNWHRRPSICKKCNTCEVQQREVQLNEVCLL